MLLDLLPLEMDIEQVLDQECTIYCRISDRTQGLSQRDITLLGLTLLTTSIWVFTIFLGCRHNTGNLLPSLRSTTGRKYCEKVTILNVPMKADNFQQGTVPHSCVWVCRIQACQGRYPPHLVRSLHPGGGSIASLAYSDHALVAPIHLSTSTSHEIHKDSYNMFTYIKFVINKCICLPILPWTTPMTMPSLRTACGPHGHAPTGLEFYIIPHLSRAWLSCVRIPCTRYATLPADATSNAMTGAAGTRAQHSSMGGLGALYLGLTVSRVGIYVLHTLLAPLIVVLKDEQQHPHILSDHILLGVSLKDSLLSFSSLALSYSLSL